MKILFNKILKSDNSAISIENGAVNVLSVNHLFVSCQELKLN